MEYIRPLFELKSVDATGIFKGYGSVFNNVDLGGDIVAPGAFKQSLSDHAVSGSWPAMLYSHDHKKEIGEWLDMKENDYGLYVEGKLWIDGEHPDPDALKAYRGMKKQRGKMGLSIGYETEEAKPTKSGDRELMRVKLWEVSPTVFPMNPKAIITSAKSISMLKDATKFSDVEAVLRERNLSRDEAATVVASIKAIAQSESAAKAEMDELLKTLRRFGN